MSDPEIETAGQADLADGTAPKRVGGGLKALDARLSGPPSGAATPEEVKERLDALDDRLAAASTELTGRQLRTYPAAQRRLTQVLRQGLEEAQGIARDIEVGLGAARRRVEDFDAGRQRGIAQYKRAREIAREVAETWESLDDAARATRKTLRFLEQALAEGPPDGAKGPQTPEQRFGAHVRAARELRAWTQDQLSRRLRDLYSLDLGQSGVARIESGARTVRLNEFVAIAQALKLNISDYAPETTLKSRQDYDTAMTKYRKLENERSARELEHTMLSRNLASVNHELSNLTHQIEVLREEIADYEALHRIDDQPR